jgi:hypothetical protein
MSEDPKPVQLADRFVAVRVSVEYHLGNCFVCYCLDVID